RIFVTLEVFAVGLPVIACEGSGAAEVVHHGQTGLLVQPGQVHSLASALRLLLLQEPARQRLGATGRRYALTEANTQICLKKLEMFYADVVKQFSQGGQKP